MIISWTGGSQEVVVDDSSYRLRKIMGTNNVQLNFSLATYIEIPLGATIQFQGLTYTLYTPQKFTEKNSKNFEYNLVFGSNQDNLANYKIKDYQNGLKFPFTGKPSEHLQLILNVLNVYEPTWTLGNCIVQTEKLISYNHTNCMDALQMIADAFNTEWEVVGKVIHLQKVSYFESTPLALSYGKGNGFVSGVGRNNDDSGTGFNVLYVQGGNRNIDFSVYGTKDLLLPKSQVYTYLGKNYVTDANGLFIVRQGASIVARKEESLDMTHIYPQRKGTISSVVVVDAVKNFYDIIDTSIPADLDFSTLRMDGEKMTIYFESGTLAGREFDIEQSDTALTGYIHAERRFKLVPKEEDGYIMPNATFIPAIGDTYAVFGMMMPTAYISDNVTKTGASWDMFKEASKHFYENEDSKFTFKGELDGIWAKTDWVNIGGKIVVGGHILFSDTQFQPTGITIRIISVKDFLNNPHSPVIELSNSVQGGGVVSELDTIAENEVVQLTLYQKALEYTRRYFRDARESIKLIQSAILDFDFGIRPVTVETMQLVVGDESLQFIFVDINGNEVFHSFTYDQNTKQLSTGAGTIQHLTLGLTDIRPDQPYLEWNVALYVSAVLDNPDASYYFYIKASKTLNTAVFLLSETPIALEGVAGYYHLLTGLLNTEYQGSRSFVTVYGFTEVLPGQIRTTTLSSGNGLQYIRLLGDRIEINGEVTFSANSPALLAQEQSITNAVANTIVINDIEFYLSTSSTSPVGGVWQTTAPAYESGKYMFMRTYVQYKDGSFAYEPSVNGTNVTGATGPAGSDGSDAQYVIVTGEQAFKFLTGSATPTQTNIVLTAVLVGGLTTYDWEYWTGSAWANLSGTQTASTYTLAYNNVAWTSTSLRVRCLSGTKFDEITIIKLYDGANGTNGINAISGYLTNETVTLPTASNGTGMVYTNAGGTFKVFNGITDVTVSTIFNIVGGIDNGTTWSKTQNGLTFTLNETTGVYSLSGSGWTTDTETFSITALYNTVTITKTYVITKAKAGVAGIDGTNGINGINGTNGQTSYFHIAYADTSIGGGFSQSPTGKAYVGTYVDFILADSNTPSDYTWVLVKGADGANGIPGTNGVDGTTSYLHIAYANSADGSVSFSTTDPTSRAYIGTYVDTNLADSTNYAVYTWQLVKGADGTNGTNGTNGLNAKVVVLTASAYVITYDSAGVETPANQSIILTATQQNHIGTVYYEFKKGATVKQNTTASTYTILDADEPLGNVADTWTITTREGSSTGTIIATDTVSIYGLQDSVDGTPGSNGTNGTNGYTAFITNQAHSFSAPNPTGYVGVVYTNSYFEIRLFQGTTEIMYGTTGTLYSELSVVLTGIAGTWSTVSGRRRFTPTSITAEQGSVAFTIYQYGTALSFPQIYTFGVSRKGIDGTQGIPGTNGTNGLTSYFHVAYATSADGSVGFSTTVSTGKTYIGTYSDFSSPDSNSYLSYSWTLIKGADGAQGIPGTNGTNGITYYLHIAYANSADGATLFSTTDPTGRAYIGTLVDTTVADSTNYALYTWSLAKGTDGTTIVSYTEQYYLSTSGTAQVGGSWIDNVAPTWSVGLYMWSRVKIVYANPTSTQYTSPIVSDSWTAVNQVQDEVTILTTKTDFLNDTLIGGNVIATGTLAVGNALGANAFISGIETGVSAIRFIAGASWANRATAPFRVLDDGTMYATKGIFSGAINVASAFKVSTIGEVEMSGKNIHMGGDPGGTFQKYLTISQLAKADQTDNKEAHFLGSVKGGTVPNDYWYAHYKMISKGNDANCVGGRMTVGNAYLGVETGTDIGFYLTADTIPYAGGVHTAVHNNNSLVRIANNSFSKFYFRGDGTFQALGNIVAYYSDERLKTIISIIVNPLDKIKTLDGFIYVNNELAKSFGYTETKRQLGVSAQQVQKVLPEAVSIAPFDLPESEWAKDNPNKTKTSASGEDYLTVDYAKMVPLLIEGIKELTAKVEMLEREIKKMKK